MTNFRRDLNNQGCCNAWQHGIRTINGQYPDDNREFGIKEGLGILITPTTAGIMITNASNALIAGDNIKLTPNGNEMIISTTDDIRVNGDLNVDGDIFQQGASYETHMEQVYTTDDYITMRDGAVTGLSAGQYAGFQIKKYDGTNDGRLVIDNSGTARVGDVGNEQPLLTREESGDLTNGDILTWDAANTKAIGIAQNTLKIPDDQTGTQVSVVFGTQAPGGNYYSSFIGLPNANQKTITVTYITIIGISTPDPSTVTVVKTKLGFYVYCSDSTCGGRSATMNVTIS